MTTISIDLGGTTIKTGIVTDGWVAETATLTSNSSDGLHASLAEIERICRSWTSRYEISSIGISFPGLVDPHRKCVIAHSAKYADAMAFDFQAWSKEKFGLPIILENDAVAAAVGENTFGCARGSENMVLLILGTGIGTAAIMNGQPVRGKHYQAGCFFGHIPMNINGRKCRACGGFGCAESEASTWALREIISDTACKDDPILDETHMDFRKLKEYYDRGDHAARSAFNNCLYYWSNCLTALIYAYDPDTVVLSGGVVGWGESLTQQLFSLVRSKLRTPFRDIRYLIAERPQESVLLGLYALSTQASKKINT